MAARNKRCDQQGRRSAFMDDGAPSNCQTLALGRNPEHLLGLGSELGSELLYGAELHARAEAVVDTYGLAATTDTLGTQIA